MINSILIIDDEKVQADSMAKLLKKENERFLIDVAYEENDILEKIENLFFNIAIVDLRMDKYSINGFEIINRINEINPFAKIIIVSAYTMEYMVEITQIISTGKIGAIIEKSEYTKFIPDILKAIQLINDQYFSKIETGDKALIDLYGKVKNEQDINIKGKNFEYFVALLFNTIGFDKITHRIKDRSSNEVDLLIRNEIEDNFFEKFNPYILVECKNQPDKGVGKNDFIQFLTKVQNTNGLANLGILITTGYIAKTTYLEAIRSSGDDIKIIFISNPQIEQLINSENKLTELKKIIDDQVKDN